MQSPDEPCTPPADPAVVELLRKMGGAVGIMDDSVFETDKFVGFFQSFRPDGQGVTGVFDDLDCGDELHERLNELFAAAGDDRRPQGGRDAYFVVRSPRPIDPVRVESLATHWVDEMAALCDHAGLGEAAERLRNIDRHRVLEGLPPKHPRQDHDKTELLKVFQGDVTGLVTGTPAGGAMAEVLRNPFYFISCDAGVRDHLMWPLVRDHFSAEDPFQPYFELWSHGVKFRVYQENQVDWYMPRL